MTRKVVVTGAAGFIGGYVVAELLRRGYRVTGVDDMSKYGPLTPACSGAPGYRFVRGDVREPGLMASLLEGCDHLIAGAALVGGIGYFHAYPYDLLAANTAIIAATADAAIAARHRGDLRKVTYLSSSMVYESAGDWPSAEGQQLRIPPPTTAYGFSKLAVEYFARAAWDQYELPFTIIRPFNCVGIGETRTVRDWRKASQGGHRGGDVRLATSHVVPDLVRRLLLGQDPLRILGTGEQLRHYTYGGDLAAGIVTAMEHPAARNEDFNLSADTGTTVAELATMIWHKIMGPDSPPRIVSDPPYDDDVPRRQPDTAKAQRMLGFTASTSLDQMLDEVISWMRQALRAGLL